MPNSHEINEEITYLKKFIKQKEPFIFKENKKKKGPNIRKLIPLENYSDLHIYEDLVKNKLKSRYACVKYSKSKQEIKKIINYYSNPQKIRDRRKIFNQIHYDFIEKIILDSKNDVVSYKFIKAKFSKNFKLSIASYSIRLIMKKLNISYKK
jgi:hypothetical protein